MEVTVNHRLLSLAFTFFIATSLVITSCQGSHSTTGKSQVTAESPHGKAHWSYTGDSGPAHWGDLSPAYILAKTGKRQSPIKIVNASMRILPDIVFDYNSTSINILNNGHTIEVVYDTGSSILVDGTKYELAQFHFHSPSEHTIEGRHADIEMHLVHKDSQGNLAVVGVMIDSGKHNDAFEPFWSLLPETEGPAWWIIDVSVNADTLLPRERGYYRYDGSLTTPPCSEGVKWFVLREHVELSAEQVQTFRSIIKDNNRPVQPLNGREVVSKS